ncbi:hypothetical protein B0H14DRAFT_3478277 [Mycena olivaceomarginata]|nr:hypothetical protein B0H14DRAFT_3478277 [Mycena olivaceomarginata]
MSAGAASAQSVSPYAIATKNRTEVPGAWNSMSVGENDAGEWEGDAEAAADPSSSVLSPMSDTARMLATPLHHTSAHAARPPMRHHARGVQGSLRAAIFPLAPHLLAPLRKRSTPADVNWESSRSLAPLGATAFASAYG